MCFERKRKWVIVLECWAGCDSRKKRATPAPVRMQKLWAQLESGADPPNNHPHTTQQNKLAKLRRCGKALGQKFGSSPPRLTNILAEFNNLQRHLLIWSFLVKSFYNSFCPPPPLKNLRRMTIWQRKYKEMTRSKVNMMTWWPDDPWAMIHDPWYLIHDDVRILMIPDPWYLIHDDMSTWWSMMIPEPWSMILDTWSFVFCLCISA